jgi:hypothetical protein
MSTASDFYAPTTTENDYMVYTAYTYKGKRIYGEFPVYVAGISLCCDDGQGNITATTVALPIHD